MTKWKYVCDSLKDEVRDEQELAVEMSGNAEE